MTIKHCGITGKKVDTLESKECYCEKCCFNDCEEDCMDHVPCQLGWYYEEVKREKPTLSSTPVTKLISKGCPKLNVKYQKKPDIWIATRGNRVLCKVKTEKEARKACLIALRDETIENIKTSKNKKQNKSYVFDHRDCYISSSASRQIAQQKAIAVVRDYYEFLLSEEERK